SSEESFSTKKIKESKTMKDLIPLMIGIGIPLIMGIGGPLLYVRSTDRRWEKIIISNQQQMAQRDKEFNAQVAGFNNRWFELKSDILEIKTFIKDLKK
ncbi:MAG: hypothetical protein RR733_04815, partial [Victivallaceae bacterium]